MKIPKTTLNRTILLAGIFALMVSAEVLGQSSSQDSGTGELRKLQSQLEDIPGELNPLFQIGGSRTLQFALRLRY